MEITTFVRQEVNDLQYEKTTNDTVNFNNYYSKTICNFDTCSSVQHVGILYDVKTPPKPR